MSESTAWYLAGLLKLMLIFGGLAFLYGSSIALEWALHGFGI